MGIHNSKSNHRLKSSSIDNNAWRPSNPSTNKSLTINKKTIYFGWDEIHRCSHNDWLHGISRKTNRIISIFSIVILT